ncbi:stress responsive a b barrel domain protein [Ophiostoma piceae UAMH 11346]|uniref:Stress responsive a b barrel domain protein n=1 Tax=Ophiostoma piceae (strain UAMH 11346) TaxID=1262450 RepID=S3CJ23_OPHP1|nr:stress responsive a b barrel domain protein [Ophiostoma piceae UAMH 11346]
MSITHVVLLHFKSALALKEVKDISERFLELEKTCIHPSTNKPYIIDARGGKDLSLNPPWASGPTHGFVFEFASLEDREYYVSKDPAHLAFVTDIKLVMEKITIVDFKTGEF